MEKFFSDLKQTFGGAVKKSGELIELTKLKLAAGETKNSIRSKLAMLGELAYLAAKGEETSASDAETIVADIDALKITLAEQEAKVAELSNKKICENCGKSVNDDAAFCPACGNPMETVE